MSATAKFVLNTATIPQLTNHLLCCDFDFIQPLSGRTNINDYAIKISSKAARFEAWSSSELVGLVAAYCNDRTTRVAHITSVSVLRGWRCKGVGHTLLDNCIAYARAAGMRQVGLEVAAGNLPAIKLYERHGFVPTKSESPFVQMLLALKTEYKNGQQPRLQL